MISWLQMQASNSNPTNLQHHFNLHYQVIPHQLDPLSRTAFRQLQLGNPYWSAVLDGQCKRNKKISTGVLGGAAIMWVLFKLLESKCNLKIFYQRASMSEADGVDYVKLGVKNSTWLKNSKPGLIFVKQIH
ncbi:hypothetical protein NE237_019533 [Protea cynaroides]|uniref:Uncharacterized protein n=1 Tax=Protea cynaroides TaxID=273540 RepID=A0A9Q0H4U8_9MAGN|nr:hypothetical protein NE237_019533 [Protea cynaroides]